MNYRHAYHAGNFADVMKHALLARMLVHLTRKPAPFRFIDTHAGIGRYDLASDEASRSGEWQDGIGRLVSGTAPPPVAALLEPYLETIGPLAADGPPLQYPGSPAVAQHVLREQDRLLLCELHPQDVLALRGAMAGDRRVKVLGSDGYQTLRAALPPTERRGLVLIDPPYEVPDEFERLPGAVAEALRRWSTGIFVVWYPIKNLERVSRCVEALRALAPAKHLQLELERDSGPGLRGTGLFVINQPHTLKAEASLLLPYLAATFGGREQGWRWRIDGAST